MSSIIVSANFLRRRIMKTRITKIVSIISILSILCLMVASCGSNSKPAYLLMCGEDNGLVAAYRAYFSLDGTTVQKVHEDRFNNLVERSGDYTLINQTTYSFTAEAKSSNASKWVFTESQYDKETYDVDQLIKYLKKMDVYYTGDIEIQIATFDSYTIIEVWDVDERTITDITTAAFKGNTMVDLQNGASLESLWKVYKLK